MRKSGGNVQSADVLTKLHQVGGRIKVRVAVNAQIEKSGPFVEQTEIVIMGKCSYPFEIPHFKFYG